MDLAVQVFFGLFVLGGCLWFGYWRWIRPNVGWLDPKGLGTLALMNLTYSFGILAAGWMNVWLGRPAPLGYMVAFGAVGILSAVALKLES